MRIQLALLCLLCGCAARTVRQPAALQPIGPSYIDLEPGWRLRVVTPILKSGGYVLQSAVESTGGNTVTISAGDDFLGYETAYYAVTARHGVEFLSAEIARDGKGTAQQRPLVPLFQFPHSVRHVRLIYLVRVSRADHDMAVAAARNIEDLEALTQRVEADPTAACHAGSGAFCAWIPAGIAVVPEIRRMIGGAVEWVPAR